jgi:hypothetical protein
MMFRAGSSRGGYQVPQRSNRGGLSSMMNRARAQQAQQVPQQSQNRGGLASMMNRARAQQAQQVPKQVGSPPPGKIQPQRQMAQAQMLRGRMR